MLDRPIVVTAFALDDELSWALATDGEAHEVFRGSDMPESTFESVEQSIAVKMEVALEDIEGEEITADTITGDLFYNYTMVRWNQAFSTLTMQQSAKQNE